MEIVFYITKNTNKCPVKDFIEKLEIKECWRHLTMKKITLDAFISEQKKNDPEFVEHYQRELLINEISKMVVNLRKNARLTQKELAKKASTTQPVIARIESGTDNRIPSLELLARIANASHAKLHLTFEQDKK